MAAYECGFSQFKWEDGLLTVNLNPPTAVGGWDVRLQVLKRFGGESGLINKYTASGYGNGASGITVLNSGTGQFQARFNSNDTSGLEPGAYAFTMERLSSGARTVLALGYLNLPQAGTV